MLALVATSAFGMHHMKKEEDFGAKGIAVIVMSWLSNIGIWLMPTSNNCYNFVLYFVDMVSAFVGADYMNFVAVAQTVPLFSQALTYGYPCFKDIDFSFNFDFNSSLMGNFFTFTSYDFTLVWTEGVLLAELFTQIAVFIAQFQDHYGMWRWIAEMPRVFTVLFYNVYAVFV